MYLLRKAHVRAYDRVSKTGALQHIREHEDGRVRRYALKLAGSKDSHDLHQIRRDRFGHLPHWNSLDELNGRWEGTTAHQRTNVETVRTGTIVYSEIKKAACFANPVARYPYSQSREHGRTSGLTKILSLPENKFNKSHNPLYLVRRRGC